MVRLFLLLLLALAQSHPPKLVSNLVKPGQPLLLTVTIQHQHQTLAQHFFHIQYSQQQPEITLPIPLELTTLPLTSNLTIQTHLYRRTADQLQLIVTETKNLTRFQQLRKEENHNWGVSYDPMDELQTVHSQEDPLSRPQEQYCTHIPVDFDIMFVVSQMAFDRISREHRLRTVGGLNYLPPLDISQLYIPTSRSRPLGSNQSLTLRVAPMSYQSYLLFYSIGHLQELKQALGVFSEVLELKEEHLDEFKEFFFMNSVWLIAAYYFLAVAEVVLKLAFIKSEFQFWKNIDQNRGVSLKTLFFELAAKTIFILYLLEHQASKIILFFDFLDLLVTLWKLSRTFSLQVSPSFPWLGLRTTDLYKKREAIDSQSIWYMNYLLVPLMVLYLGYALISRGGRVSSWYRFVLETTVAFIGIFGFILMTPQLYINYKLKSVDHLNWRGLIYRFVTTVIDDLFAFMVTMPGLRRLLYFRDDIIFLVYIYQRQIYATDFSRKTIFTQSAQPEPPTTALKTE